MLRFTNTLILVACCCNAIYAWENFIQAEDVWTEHTAWSECTYYNDGFPSGINYSLGTEVSLENKEYFPLFKNGEPTGCLVRLHDNMLFVYAPEFETEYVAYDFNDWQMGKSLQIKHLDVDNHTVVTKELRLTNGKVISGGNYKKTGIYYNNNSLLANVGYINDGGLLMVADTMESMTVSATTVASICNEKGEVLLSNPVRRNINIWCEETVREYTVRLNGHDSIRHLRFNPVNYDNDGNKELWFETDSREWIDKNIPVIPTHFQLRYDQESTDDYSIPFCLPNDMVLDNYHAINWSREPNQVVYDMTYNKEYATVAFNGTSESPSYIPVVVVVRQAEPLVVNNVCWRRFHPEIHPISETGIDWNRTLPGPEYIVEGIGPTDRGLPGWLDCSEETADGPASGITITFNNLYFRDNDFVMGGANTIGGQMRTDRTWEYLLIDNDGQYNELFRMRFSKEEPKSDGAWDETAEMSVVSRLAFDDNGEESELREINPYVGYTYNMGRSGNEVFLLNEDEDRVLYRYPVQDGYVAPKGAFGLHVENGDTFIEQSFIWKANFWTRIDMMTCCGVTAEIAGDSGRNITYVQGIGVTDGGIYPRPTISSDSARPRIILNNVYDSEGNVVYAGAGIVPPVPNIVDTNPEDENNVVVFYNMQGQRVMSPRPGDLLIRQTSGKTEKIIF